ncbi:MAG: hypothetical protein IJM59_09035 [Proteobacteria bacterium]|nr:hypothetical protein [Pseudomonadota bacterium]
MPQREKFWSYVAVFGMLWGGLELTLGTFLHVLHVPKTGLIMTALSVVLLIAQRNIFPVRGSTLAVGVVAACIKCLSPGGIILGPVVGILSEALLLELGLLLGSRNVVSVSVAGSLALIFSQLQSVFKIWIYYGQDFIDGLVRAIEKFFSVPMTATLGWGVLLGFLGIICGLGVLTGLTGRSLGRRVNARLKELESSGESPECLECACEGEDPKADLCTEATNGGESGGVSASMNVISGISTGKRKQRQPDEQIIRTRFFLLPAALATLIAQFSGELWLSSLALAVWLSALFIGGRSVLKSIWWPKFWALTIGVSLVCGLILAWNLDGTWEWMTGLEASARMIVRGLYVFSLISWGTRCVRTEEFLTLWKRIHLAELGAALETAYSLLPEWLERLNKLVKSRPGGVRNNLRYAYDSLLDCLVDASRSV